ncbi:hypothetical protein Sme01_04950 [Sphaerisporangium melleum]|uniref:DUF3152 domain-containing protein n=1 Tax=Sphaerisporangium melleum TaxID=321316 RepID=A0A917VCL2_9ACTN|nr:DUF3152 domain-containing protein [Sphaerisporangium melleum]GGK62882.1 hypothetical protein GCM10007964_02520 [Sphaerisporangium melleum]GII68019.1 hypothetical protein Sme01_04950 [Sphaerisporangium melleum]
MALTTGAALLIGGCAVLLGGQDAEVGSAARVPGGTQAAVADAPGATPSNGAASSSPGAPGAAHSPAVSLPASGGVTATPGGAASASDDGPGSGPDADLSGTRDTGSASGDRAKVIRVPHSGKGRYKVVRGTARPPAGGRGKVVRYIVEVERGLPFDPEEFAATVHRTLNDPRSWGRGRTRFKRVDHGPARFRVALSSPAMTDRRCRPLQTFGELSCWNGRRSVINAKRWAAAIPDYRGDLVAYRQYVVNHEVGHALGHGHEPCPGRGRVAPVMTQQTKSLQGCRPNPWPYPRAKGRKDSGDRAAKRDGSDRRTRRQKSSDAGDDHGRAPATLRGSNA